MFKGEYNHSIDSKGRVIVPAKFREQLGESFVVTKGLDGCLFVFPNDSWQEFEDKLSSLSTSNMESRKLVRFFTAGAADCEIDKQGRALIPGVLRDFAGLDKDVVIIGVAKRIEFWSKDKWNSLTDECDSNMDEIAANLDALGVSL